jgi:hypothetical protein
MSERFFTVTVIAGRVFPWGLPQRGPWRSDLLAWQPEEAAEADARRGSPLDRVVRTEAELQDALGASAPAGLPEFARILWVHEALEPAVQCLWEAQWATPQESAQGQLGGING